MMYLIGIIMGILGVLDLVSKTPSLPWWGDIILIVAGILVMGLGRLLGDD